MHVSRNVCCVLELAFRGSAKWSRAEMAHLPRYQRSKNPTMASMPEIEMLGNHLAKESVRFLNNRVLN